MKPNDAVPVDSETKSFAEFLERIPPTKNTITIADLVESASSPAPEHWRHCFRLKIPKIRIHCESCSGLRFFRCSKADLKIDNVSISEFKDYLLYFKCSDCRATHKTFAIRAKARGQDRTDCTGEILKFGEYPPFGPPTPSGLIGLIGTDRELFLKGRRCEIQDLGIGAFSYYRRIVENQKDRIFQKIIEAAKTLSSPPEMIEALKTAQTEVQFRKAVQEIKGAIPECLLIKGHNPLMLLHSALSKGLHEQDDQTCLHLAHDIRVVLIELSDRISEVLRDERELNEAVARLLSGSKKIET